MSQKKAKVETPLVHAVIYFKISVTTHATNIPYLIRTAFGLNALRFNFKNTTKVIDVILVNIKTQSAYL